MGKFCHVGCSHLITEKKEIGGVPTGFKCSFYKIKNPAVPHNRKYKHWGRKETPMIAGELAIEENRPLRCKKCREDT